MFGFGHGQWVFHFRRFDNTRRALVGQAANFSQGSDSTRYRIFLCLINNRKRRERNDEFDVEIQDRSRQFIYTATRNLYTDSRLSECCTFASDKIGPNDTHGLNRIRRNFQRISPQDDIASVQQAPSAHFISAGYAKLDAN